MDFLIIFFTFIIPRVYLFWYNIYFLKIVSWIFGHNFWRILLYLFGFFFMTLRANTRDPKEICWIFSVK